MWNTDRQPLSRILKNPYFSTPRDFSNPRILEQNLSIYQSNLNLTSLFQSKTLILSPPQPFFLISREFDPISFLPYEVQNERDSTKSDLTFRLKILNLRDVLESSLFYLSYRRFSSMYSWNKLPWTVKDIVIQGKLMLLSQQGTSFILTWDQALSYTKSDNFTNMYSFFRYSHRFKANPWVLLK